MSKFNVKIGYPDEWIDYSTLDFGPLGNEAPFLTMQFAQERFHIQRTVKEMNAPTNRKKWFMTP